MFDSFGLFSDMTVVTCHELVSVGTRLEYDHDGKLTKRTPCPRQVGVVLSHASIVADSSGTVAVPATIGTACHVPSGALLDNQGKHKG